MEAKKSTKKINLMYRSFCLKLTEEYGYTYIELTIALSLLIILFPAVFFLTHTLEAGFKKVVNREELQMEYRVFHSMLTREVNQANHFSLEGKNLVIELPTGEIMRYELKKRQIIRSMKKRGDTHFQGTTIVLQHVYFSALIPDGYGVYVDVGLQNWYATLDVSTYIAKRVVG